MFCVEIESIVNTLFKNENIVLCRGTAASYLGLSNGWGIPLEFYTTNNKIMNSNYINGIIVDSLEELNIIKINDILCTNKETTICDLIIHECSVQEILESMADYYYEHEESFDGIMETVERYRIIKEFNSYVKDAIEYYSD